MRHTLEKARPFEPTGKGGGSKPGKPQWTWRRRVPCDSPLVTVYNNVVSNRVSTVDGWHEYLEPKFKENE